MELVTYKSEQEQYTVGSHQTFPKNDIQVLQKTVEGMVDSAWEYQEVSIAVLKGKYVVNRLGDHNGKIIPSRGNSYEQRSRRG